MKPKEYISKYNLKNPKYNFRTKEFVADLTIDFNTLISYHSLFDWNYNKFQLCVKDIRQKFTSIQNRTAHPLVSDKLWNYFYATVVGRAKDSMFGEQLKRERDKQKKKKKERERYRDFNSYFWQKILDEQVKQVLNLLDGGYTRPAQSFNVLGLSESATEQEIKDSYRKLAFQHHPDKQGNSAKFREVTEAKNRCLAYASTRKAS